jgi:methionine synthase II (cobalamin-independent)
MSQTFRGIHLVGSMPFHTGQELFDFVGDNLKNYLARVPEETGARAGWIATQVPHFMGNPAMEMIPPPPGAPIALPRAQLKEGLTAEDLKFEGGFHYGPAAAESYDLFKQAKVDGKVSADARLQVSLPGPQNPVGMFVTHKSQHETLKAYNEEIKKSVDEILAAVPHDQLAIQWDLVAELGALAEVDEGMMSTAFTADDAKDSIELMATWVPEDVELGYHLCYGDSNRDNVQPGVKSPIELHSPIADTSIKLRKTLDAIFEVVGRRVDFIQMAIPLNFNTASHFEALEGVEIPAGTELFLGLVHPQDSGLDEARNRAELAAAAVGSHEFGISTECGMGRYGEESGKFVSAIDKLTALAGEYEKTGTPG